MGLSLYSVDGGINQANSMSQGVQTANMALQQENNVATENYNATKAADKTQATNDLINNVVHMKTMQSGVKAALNPVAAKTFAGGKALAGGVQSSKDVTGLRGAVGSAEELGSRATKAVGVIGSVAGAGMDIAADFKAGGIAGDNWEEKTANIGGIISGALDVAGLIPGFQGLEALGQITGAASAAVGAAGDAVQSAKDAANTVTAAQTVAVAPSVGVATARTL